MIKNDKDFLQKFDEFLGLFDVEELIKDGINFVRFRYEKGQDKRTVRLSISELQEIKKKRGVFNV